MLVMLQCPQALIKLFLYKPSTLLVALWYYKYYYKL